MYVNIYVGIYMSLPFVNRFKELEILNKKRFVSLSGRRRLGKSCLVDKYLDSNSGLRLQAIESSPALQVESLWEDLREVIQTDLKPVTIKDLLELINLEFAHRSKAFTLCFDEFPYLVNEDSSVASQFQKWMGQKKFPKNLRLVFLGSSRQVMRETFERVSGALFDRTYPVTLQPLGYKEFCQATGRDCADKDNFLIYSLLGGCPFYWDTLLDGKMDALSVANEHFFHSGAFFEDEPIRLLRDEKVDGTLAVSVLDSIGRGASKPSEIASRAQKSLPNLSRILKLLDQTFLAKSTKPFGSSEAKSRSKVYSIEDPALGFLYSVARKHGKRWQNYSQEHQRNLLNVHASKVMERSFRAQFNSEPYWEEKKIEVDAIRYVGDSKEVIISELKLAALSASEKKRIKDEVTKKVQASGIPTMVRAWKVEVIDWNDFVNAL